MERAQAVDRYIASQSDDRRAAMETLRDTINAAAPDATETIAYGMPALRGKSGSIPRCRTTRSRTTTACSPRARPSSRPAATS